MTSDSVIKDWVHKLTWKEQSALFTAIRGSDAQFNPHVRSVVRWLRNCILYDADVNGVFVKFGVLPQPKDLKNGLEYMTVHFVGHLMHGLQIIGYRCPDEEDAKLALGYYIIICHILHCNPETEEQMTQRLKDNRKKDSGQV